MNVAVTGGTGVLGRALAALRPKWRYLSRAECDVTLPLSSYNTLRELRPNVILHAAAITDHQCSDLEKLIDVNIAATRNIARTARAIGAHLVYVSTHYVYAGHVGGYDEFSVPAPIGAYAATKYEGELWVEEVLKPYDAALIVRGSWYTRETRLEHWARRGPVFDAYCSREPVEVAARKIVALVEARVRGVVNIGGSRRSFVQILNDEGYADYARPVSRHDIQHTPYEFPCDTSVNTAKFDALQLAW